MATKSQRDVHVDHEIDGSEMEGGGQVVRISAALSCLLGHSIRVNKVRAGRSKPGLRPQHLTGIILVKDLCGGRLENAQVKSEILELYPGKVKSGSYMADIGTAGSICLLMQLAIPCLYCADGETFLTLKGGTNADMAPQADYYIMVFKPIAEKFGLKFDIDITRRGFFPKGGGEVRTRSYPTKSLNAVTMLDRGNVVRIYGISYVAGALPLKVAAIMANCAEKMIRQDLKEVPININVVKESPDKAFGTGTGIMLVAETENGCLLAGSALGRKGVSAEEIGQSAGESLLNNVCHGGCVDDYLQDQLIILMALAKGKSQVKCGPLSLHTETAIHVAKQITKAKFEVKELSKSSYIIECEGVGLENPYL